MASISKVLQKPIFSIRFLEFYYWNLPFPFSFGSILLLFFIVVCTFKASLLQTFVILEPFALMHFKKSRRFDEKVDETFLCALLFSKRR